MIRSPLFNDLLNLRNTVDQLFGNNESPFGESFNTLWSRGETGGRTVAHPMPIDVYATDDDVVIVAAVPGMNPEDLDLTVHRNTVTLSGSIRDVMDSDEGKDATWYVHELTNGSFRRSVTLPFLVDSERATANFEHGILRVVLPKSEAAKPQRIAINPGQSEAITAGSNEQS